jgi:protein TonB
MKSKKNPQANNERLRIPLIFLGFFIVGSIITLSFSYKEVVVLASTDRELQEKDDIPEKTIIKEDPKKEEPVVEDIPEPEVDPPPTEETKTKENEDKDEKPDIESEPIKFDEDPEPAQPEPVDFPDQEASFPGGDAAMKKFLAENMNYPEMAMELGDEGRVYVEFVVNRDGSIEQVKILKGVSGDIDGEARRVVNSMPQWTPAELNGERVRARCRIPINFKLQ